jgi:beta-glucosidase
VLATAKHFIGDGGTTGGKDQGETQLSAADLRAIHLPPFRAAVARGVGAVMISYSSWNGVKMHANRYLITDVLKGELGFSGFVVSDWQGIDQIDGQSGFTANEVATAVNAGLDMVMVPYDYGQFINLLRQDVQNGQVPMSRIDDANGRILTKKFELGLFEQPYTDRSYTGTVGSAAHRTIARQADRESQVLLKNRNAILPLPKTQAKLFVAGKNADNIGNQRAAAGRSPGRDPAERSRRAPRSSRASATLWRAPRPSPTTATANSIDSSYTAAVAVVGEAPYAEGAGDRPNGPGLDGGDLATIARLKAAGVPVVVVLVSGRPLDIASEIGGWDALLEAWLPGSENAGVADVLFGDYGPTGKLPSSWPSSAGQEPSNDGDGKTPLFPFGFGLSYGQQPPPVTRNPYDQIAGAGYDEQLGTQTEHCGDPGCGDNVGWIAAGDYLGYTHVDFGATAPSSVTTRVASGSSATGTIEYRLDNPTGTRIASVPVTNTGGWQTWVSTTVATSTPATGAHKLYLVFTARRRRTSPTSTGSSSPRHRPAAA